MESITLEQIKNNPNLDLTERRLQYNNAEGIDDLCVATIKRDYELWAKERTVVNDRTNYLLEQILNGHILTKEEAFEMLNVEKNKIDEAIELEKIKNNIENNKGITLEDFNYLCSKIDIDSDTIVLMKNEFTKNNLFVDEYSDEHSIGGK